MKITPIYFLFFILLSMFSCQVEGVDKKKEVELDEKQDLPSVPSSSKNKTLQPISTKDIEKFKNSVSKLSKASLSKTEKISLIFV